jgi:hypothetical protein
VISSTSSPRDDVVEVDDAWLKDLLAAEGEELSGQRGGPGGGALDLFDVLVHLAARRDVVEREAREAEDDGEQVVEIVRYAARQPSYRLHLLCLPELLLRLSERGLGLSTDRQIAGDLGDPDDRPRGVPNRGDSDGDLDLGTVLPATPGLVLMYGRASAGRFQELALTVFHLVRGEQQHRLSHHLVSRILVQRLRGSIPARDGAVQVGAQNGVLRRVDDGGQARARQGGEALRGDIGDQRQSALERTPLVEQGVHLDRGPQR